MFAFKHMTVIVVINIVTVGKITLTSGFRRAADEICAVVEYYAPSSGNPLPTFRDNVSIPSFLLGLLDP
jgi:hypothetical protein